MDTLSISDTRPSANSAVFGAELWPDLEPIDHVCFTVVSGDRPLSKRFGVSNSKPVKVEGDAVLASGIAHRFSLKGTPSEMATLLAADLAALGTTEALICAPPPQGRKQWRVVTADEVKNHPGAIARTKEFFTPVAGPALMGLDFDIKDFPTPIRERLLAMGPTCISDVLAKVFPQFEHAASVSRPSMSVGIRHRASGSETDRDAGQHRYYFVADGSDIEAFAKRLRDRLFLAGWAWGIVSKSGAILPRTLFDVTASSDTSRLFYEGAPILEDPALEYLAARRAAVPKPGILLNTRLLPELTNGERQAVGVIHERMRLELADEAARARSQWANEMQARSPKVSASPSFKRDLSRAVDDNVLQGDFPIDLDDGTVITARDLLADPQRYHRKTCPDPVEPEYGGGRNKAIVYSDGSPIRIESQAHGGVSYLVLKMAEDYFDHALAKQGAEEGKIEADDGARDPLDPFGQGDTSAVLDVPAGALPKVIERWALDVSERMGAPTAYATIAALATVSGAIGSKLKIQPKQHDTTWTEPAFLWFAIVEEPGGKKSPVIAAATAPLSTVDAQHAREGAKAWDEWADRKSQRKKGEPSEPEPKLKRNVVEGFTMEALTGVLAENPNGVLVRQDELTQLIGSFDAYKANKGSDRPMMLSLFDGRETRVDRAGKRHTYVPCWGASVLGGIQPRKITELARNLDADGLLQRFLLVWGDGGKHKGVDRAPDNEAMLAYSRMIQELALADFVFPDPITLSPGAHHVWLALGERIERLEALPGVSDAWRGHLGKWPGFSNRLLLICHVLDQWPGGQLQMVTTQVSVATAQRALKLCEWLLGNSIRFYQECIGAGEAGDDARWVAGHILAAQVEGVITRRDLGQARREFRDDPDRASRAMRFLESMDWCTPDFSQRTDRGGATRWTICPLVHARFASNADRERERRARERHKIELAANERRLLTVRTPDGQ
jgi:hypothetical protein